jgi:hypothetical protein
VTIRRLSESGIAWSTIIRNMNGGSRAIAEETTIVIRKPMIDRRYGRANFATRRIEVLPIFAPATADLSRGIS